VKVAQIVIDTNREFQQRNLREKQEREAAEREKNERAQGHSQIKE
jgi:hypothetical protein